MRVRAIGRNKKAPTDVPRSDEQILERSCRACKFTPPVSGRNRLPCERLRDFKPRLWASCAKWPAFGADYAEAQEWLLRQLTRIRAAREGERPRFTFEEASCRYLQERESKPSLEDEILYLKLAMPYVGALLLDEICDETLAPLVSALKAPVMTKRKDGTATARVRKNKTVNLVLGT